MTPGLIQHYAQLCHHYRYALFKAIFTSIVGIAAISYLLLLVRPSYTASTTVVVLPTEAQMAFARESASGYEATSSLSGTLLEYLVSRPVLDPVLDQLQMGREIGVQEVPETFLEHLAEALKGFRKGVMKTLRILNSGEYVESDPRASALDQLADGIDLSYIPGTLVIEIEVTLPHAQDAAVAANALAAAYLNRKNLELAQTAEEIESFLQQEVASRQALLASLRLEEVEKRRMLGLESLEGERTILQSARETERQKQADARTERAALEATIEGLLIGKARARSAEALAQVGQEISSTRIELESLKREVIVRQQTLESIMRQLDSLHEKGQPIEEIAERVAVVETDLVELNDQLLMVHLTRSSTANQVRIINPAIVPLYPSFPQVLLNVILGSIVAVLLALVIMIVSDTFSGTVKTEEDFRTLENAVCVGGVSAKAVSWPMSESSGKRKKWDKLRQSLLERLALLGALDNERIRLTGFVSPDQLATYREFLDETIVQPPDPGLPDEQAPSRPAPTTVIESLPTIGADFRWSRVVSGDSVLCLVPAGRVSEDQVQRFAVQVAARGASGTFLLLRS